MVSNTSTVQNGMTVLDPTGDKIGTVKDILAVQAVSANDTAAAATAAGLYDTPTTVDSTGSGQQYLKVEQGGVLGIGATDLYVPMDAVQNVVPGDSVTINCTKDTCGSMYGNKPGFLP